MAALYQCTVELFWSVGMCSWHCQLHNYECWFTVFL